MRKVLFFDRGLELALVIHSFDRVCGICAIDRCYDRCKVMIMYHALRSLSLPAITGARALASLRLSSPSIISIFHPRQVSDVVDSRALTRGHAHVVSAILISHPLWLLLCPSSRCSESPTPLAKLALECGYFEARYVSASSTMLPFSML